MKIRGPLITLAAAATLGFGILTVNIFQESGPVVAGTPVASSTSAPATPAPAPSVPQFPAKADFVGKIPTANGTITLDISVEGAKAIAYACDGTSIESWLRGPAVDGAVNLASKDGTGRLQGRLDGPAVVGTLWIGQKKWAFTAEPAQRPAGLYVSKESGVRGSWIVDTSGKATGVLRLDDGSTMPAPGLTTDGTAVVDGRTVAPTRVQGDSDV